MKNHVGRFIPKNPKKYLGDANNIIYRSNWEKRVMIHLDRNDAVIQWGSEELSIKYMSPLDNRYHKYFPDFVVKAKDASGNIKTIVMEVKPHKETVEPNRTKGKAQKTLLYEIATWGKNQAKWNAAREFCQKNGWEFRILTEYDLGIK